MSGAASRNDPTSEELADIFEHDVVGRLVTKKDGGRRVRVSGRRPRVVFIAGQPASQKTSVQSEVERDLDLDQPAEIDADAWRDLHPLHPGWEEEDDLTAASLSHPVVSGWVDDAIRYVAREGFDAVVSATLKNRHKAEEKIRPFRDATPYEYEIYVVFTAVDALTSRLSIVERYLRSKRRGVPGRYVPADVHDAAYEGVLYTARDIDEKRLGPLSVRVYRRGDGETTLAYRNTLPRGSDWLDDPKAEEVLVRERYDYWDHNVGWFSNEARRLLNPDEPPLRQEVSRHVAGTMCNLLQSVCLRNPHATAPLQRTPILSGPTT
jgi:zeta toxin